MPVKNKYVSETDVEKPYFTPSLLITPLRHRMVCFTWVHIMRADTARKKVGFVNKLNGSVAHRHHVQGVGQGEPKELPNFWINVNKCF